MPRYLVSFTAEIEVEAEEAGYAEEVAIDLINIGDLCCTGVELSE